jgi:hypothetical protein
MARRENYPLPRARFETGGRIGWSDIARRASGPIGRRATQLPGQKVSAVFRRERRLFRRRYLSLRRTRFRRRDRDAKQSPLSADDLEDEVEIDLQRPRWEITGQTQALFYI